MPTADNICKFISEANAEHLAVQVFVYETDQAVMENKTSLQRHRMLLVLKGKGKFFFDGKDFSYSAGDLIFGFEGERFFAAPTDTTEYLYICFAGMRADALFRRFGITPRERRREGFDGLLPLWRESLLRASEQNVDLATESILLYTFSRLSADTAPKTDIVERIVVESEKSFADPSLSLTALAAILGYNPKYISHLFKKKMGVGYAEYLRALRLKYAVSLFDFGIASIKNVALLSGFSDPLYFSTVFKKEMGISPKDYVEKKNVSHTAQT